MPAQPQDLPVNRSPALPGTVVTWPQMATQLGVDSSSKIVLALSGGADSVYLLDLLRRIEGAPEILAVHVNHGLRGDASRGDESFCRELCEDWKVPFEGLTVELGAGTEDLERRAREARYGALARSARRHGIRQVLTAHHRDDLVETLLMRWLRGSSAPGMVGLRPRSKYPIPTGNGEPIALLRPLLLECLQHLGAKKISGELTQRGIPWREDETNRSMRFTRNRIRHQLLPLLRSTCSPSVMEDLFRFQKVLAEHEERLAPLRPTLNWQARPASKRPSWRLPRRELETCPAPLLRRAIYADLLQRTGRAPRDGVQDALAEALFQKTDAHWNLRGGWGLTLDGPFLRLKAPPR
jgi:tRNA(Ile)-lysidine synthetase-like protein